MFEEICLVCGKHLKDDGYASHPSSPPPFSYQSITNYSQAYCSDDCQSIDITSPSISSSSSVMSSPHLGYAAGSDVPALVPSALGSALSKYRTRDHYSVSSSSASSTSWALTDDESDELGAGSECSFNDTSDSLHEGSCKSINNVLAMASSALSYARRPSGTNNRSLVPHVHKRTSTGSLSGHVRGVPRSAPIHSLSSNEDEESLSDFGYASRDGYESGLHLYPEPKPKPTKTKRNHNRASLPAYFSLLQMNTPSAGTHTSPVSSSSGNTIARPSPPTPKLALASGLPQANGTLTSHVLLTHATPRGRRRVADHSSCSRRSGHSPSPSRSHSRQEYSPKVCEYPLRGARLDSRGSVEQVFDWSSMPGLPSRGRAAVRRNSSPPPKMVMGLEDPVHIFSAARKIDLVDRPVSDARSRQALLTRGRARAEELDGFGLADAPGFGYGRSGLINRERTTGYSMRVPL